MRITRDTLLKIARDAAAQRVRTSRRIVCMYLTGSLLGDEPVIGGTADVDLICVHDGEPTMRREIVRLTDEVHLDIGHYAQADFSQPRHLRHDPWLGPQITSHPLLLHDAGHWFDFTQAAITAQFNTPENILERARALANQARQSWLNLRMGTGEATSEAVWSFLKALENAGNAGVALTGAPLGERRFWQGLPERCAAAGYPELAGGLLGLFQSLEPATAEWQAWQDPWRAALAEAGKLADCPARLHPARTAYYMHAAAALLENQPAAASWLCLRTWTQAVALQPTADGLVAWQNALGAFGLGGEGFSARLDALDTHLDHLEEVLDAWGKANGI
jgi:hypothetical protein